MKRVASIFLPMWPVDLLRRRRERAKPAIWESGDLAIEKSAAEKQTCKSPNRQITRSSNADPILIIALERGVQIVKHCCEVAASFGITPGMTLAHARALVTTAQCAVEEDDPQRDLQSLHKLALWAQRYSPLVAPDPPDGLLIDITGCQRVFGGEEKLASIIASDLHRLGFRAQVAMASTFACAAAVARSAMEPRMYTDEHGCENNDKRRKGEEEKRGVAAETPSPLPLFPSSPLLLFTSELGVIPPGHEQYALAPLPLETLRLDPQTIAALHEIEIVRIGQLFDLPRDQVADRFGGELLLRLDQATGHGAIEAIEPVRLKHPPRVEHVFDGPVLQLEGVMLMTHSLLEQLAAKLVRMERGVCRLDLEFVRIDASPIRVAIRLSHPSRNVKHIWSLLKPKVESINLGFGVEEISLVASRSHLVQHQQDEMKPQMPPPRLQKIQTGEFIDTLINRLGNDRVLRCELFASHVPERAFRMRSAMETDRVQSRTQSSEVRCELDRPPILLPQPEQITIGIENGLPRRMTWQSAESTITECIGPEAIASEWWKEPASGLREYYKVQHENGLWLWLFYQHASDQWFIHGVWG